LRILKEIFVHHGCFEWKDINAGKSFSLELSNLPNKVLDCAPIILDGEDLLIEG